MTLSPFWAAVTANYRFGWTCCGNSFHRSPQRHACILVLRAEGRQGGHPAKRHLLTGPLFYEMFTGEARSETQSNPSELVQGLDPAIDRVILQCLENDPKRRPSSARTVAMALPGADPIAAVLAAGETPAPEMIAASPEKARISPKTAVVCFSCTVLSLLLWVVDFRNTILLCPRALQIPPDGLRRSRPTIRESDRLRRRTSLQGSYVCLLRAESHREPLSLSRRTPDGNPCEPPAGHSLFRVSPASQRRGR